MSNYKNVSKWQVLCLAMLSTISCGEKEIIEDPDPPPTLRTCDGGTDVLCILIAPTIDVLQAVNGLQVFDQDLPSGVALSDITLADGYEAGWLELQYRSQLDMAFSNSDMFGLDYDIVVMYPGWGWWLSNTEDYPQDADLYFNGMNYLVDNLYDLTNMENIQRLTGADVAMTVLLGNLGGVAHMALGTYTWPLLLNQGANTDFPKRHNAVISFDPINYEDIEVFQHEFGHLLGASHDMHTTSNDADTTSNCLTNPSSRLNFLKSSVSRNNRL